MFGFSVEKALGPWYKYLALILLGGLGGNIFSATITAYSVSVGASTSLFAITGALIVWFYRYWDILGPMKLQYGIFLGLMLLFAFLNGFMDPRSGIDNWGHLGGLIYGLLLTPLILKPLQIEGQS
jgi:rhomboid protease GluP